MFKDPLKRHSRYMTFDAIKLIVRLCPPEKSTHFLACVAWRFWLLSNKGGRGQKNREEIGAGATEKPPARTGGFFESVRMPAYGSFRLVQNARPSIKYFGNFPWESFERLNKSSRQKQNQNMAEALTRALSLLNIRREIVQLS